MPRVFSFLFVAALLSLATRVHATVRKVPADYPTIQQAINAAFASDTVTVAPGYYNGYMDITGRSLLLKSDSGSESTTLAPDFGIRINAMGGNYSITIEGFTVSLYTYVPAVRAHESGTSGKLVIRHNRFTGNRNDVIFATWRGEIDIHHNLFDRNHSVDKSAIYIEYPTRFSSRIFNNTIYDNTFGIWGSLPPYLRNNIVVHNSRVGVTSYYVSSDSIPKYNDVFGNVEGDYDRVPPGTGSISVPPLFVDSSSDDFRLHWNSPCVDAGDTSVQYNDPDGTRNDMGAFPYLCTVIDDSADCDQDGVINLLDNCPYQSNAPQSDSDDDGVGDECDVCPLDQGNDPDGDGYCSSVDNCPNVFNANQADSNANGIGDACECACRCHGDPICDGVRSDILDIVGTVDVAFGASPIPPDPSDPCPMDRTDVDCSSSTNVVDVVKVINVTFRGANPATEYCHPCEL